MNTIMLLIKRVMILRLAFVITFSILSPGFLNAKTLDHEIFLQKMENSSNQVYLQCIKKYDDYLDKNPNDISVLIEKCKFIEFAQYDDYEDYNPNQNMLDTCRTELVRKYPDNPDVIIYQTTYLWGDKLEEVFKKAKQLIFENPQRWTKENKAIIYNEIANQHFWENEYQLAHNNILIAIGYDAKYKSTLAYAQILAGLDKNKEACDILYAINDTTLETWELSQKANLFLELEKYSEALEIYNHIEKTDSTYINNTELANTLVGVGENEFARKYLVSDTSKFWDKETAIRNLLKHDLKHQNGERCIQSYNALRDLGFMSDPLGIYRIKLFFKHPFETWKFRDLISVIVFLLALIILVLIPSVWILPIYFVGHKWKLTEKEKPHKIMWGLKAFWFVSVGYLFADFFSYFVDPDILYYYFNDSLYFEELSTEKLGLMSLLFMLMFAAVGILTLYKKNLSIFFGNLWSIRKSILLGFGILFLYRIAVGIYVGIGVLGFDVSLNDIANIPGIFLSSRDDIEAVISIYGTLTSFLLICILVPIYEEIIFRGVIYEATLRYINFNTANIIQAFLFATIHWNIFLFPVFFLFGIITGILRKKSGGLLAGIVFHILNNTVALAFMLLRG